MKRIAFVLTILLAPVMCDAQISAVTSNGDEVILHENGTWNYVSTESKAPEEIKTNPKPFSKSSNASFLVKSKIVDMGIYVDPKKWNFGKPDDHEDAEFEFSSRTKDAYGMLITERIEIPLEGLKSIALENARSVAPDIRVVKEEYRKVNGVQVLMMQMNGTIMGVKFTYYSYYYSYSGGTIQFITYTSQNLLEEYLPDLEELLNGFVLL